MTRNHFVCYGLVLFLFGMQLLLFQSFVLSEAASKVYYEKIERKESRDFRELNRVVSANSSIPFVRKKVEHPRWLGWPFVSIGAVLVFQSFAMRKE